MFNRVTHLAITAATIGAVACSPTPANTRASGSVTTTSTAGTAAESAGTGGPGADAGPATGAPGAASTAPGGVAPQAGPTSTHAFSGAIVESMNAGGYTYAQLKGDADAVWIAGPEFDAKVGEVVAVSLDMPMQGFESKTLKRTFPLLYFVSEVARNGQPLTGGATAARTAVPAAPAMATGHGADRTAMPLQKLEPPAGGLAIADVFARKAALSGKTVIVRGTVVKFNGGILDRNWLHIQDGSGAAAAHNNDLTVTTDAQFKVGDVVTLSGVLGTDKDFGAGYAVS